MTDRADNIEPVARDLYARRMRALGVTEAEIAATSDRYWPVLAAGLQAGLIEEDGNEVPHTVEQGIEAWCSWLDERKA